MILKVALPLTTLFKPLIWIDGPNGVITPWPPAYVAICDTVMMFGFSLLRASEIGSIARQTPLSGAS